IPFNMERTMFVGIDVNHPSELERVHSSVSAAVGSLDPFFSQYTASISVQKKETDEIVRNIGPMISELLEEYQRVNSALPENMIIFRDGVSEGQFQQVCNTELPNIQAGINKVTKARINITLINITKKHN